MRKCPNCNNDVEDEANFCMMCGCPVTPQPTDGQQEPDAPAAPDSGQTAQTASDDRTGNPINSISNRFFQKRWSKVLMAAAAVSVVAVGVYVFSAPSVGGEDYKKGVEFLREAEFTKARDSFQKGVEEGDAAAMVVLADLYVSAYEALETKSDPVELVEPVLKKPDGGYIETDDITQLYQAAIDKDFPKAMYALGNFKLGENKGMDNSEIRDIKAARELLKQAVDRGYDNATALRKLAYSYTCSDENIEPSYQESAKWYRKAIDKGDTKAMVEFGKLLHNPNGSDISNNNIEEAIGILQKAAELGEAEAAEELSSIYSFEYKDHHKEMQWLKKAVDMGSTSAFNRIGVMYERGEGVEQNYDTAIAWYKKGADAGDIYAIKNLAYIYSSSDFGEQNYIEAIKWYKKAAELGDTQAMYDIGCLYDEGGNGIARDLESARKWYKMASERGDDWATFKLGILYYEGKGVKKDYAEAMRLFQKAGNGTAKFYIGEMYRKGQGVDKDYIKALDYYQSATEEDSDEAYWGILHGSPNALDEVPFYAMLHVFSMSLVDFPESEGYEPVKKKLDEFFDGSQEWKTPDLLNVYTPYGIQKRWGWTRADNFGRDAFIPFSADKFSECLKSYDNKPFRSVFGYPIELMAGVVCKGVGPDIYTWGNKAKYDVAFLVYFSSKRDVRSEVEVFMNGRQINAPEFFSQVYLNN